MPVWPPSLVRGRGRPRTFDETRMGGCDAPGDTPACDRATCCSSDAFVVGWSVGRAAGARRRRRAPVTGRSSRPPFELSEPVAEPVVDELARASRRPLRLALAGGLAALVRRRRRARAPARTTPALRSSTPPSPPGSMRRPRSRRRPRGSSCSAASSSPASPHAESRLRPISPRTPLPPPLQQPFVQPSDRAIALDNYLQALGTRDDPDRPRRLPRRNSSSRC